MDDSNQNAVFFIFVFWEMFETTPSDRWRYIPAKDGTNAICQF